MASSVFRFMDLPRELRDQIYEMIIKLEPNDLPFLFRGQRTSRPLTLLETEQPNYHAIPMSRPKKPVYFDLLTIPTFGSEFRPVYIANQRIRVPRSQIMDYIEDWCVKTGTYRGKIFADICDHGPGAIQDLKPIFEFCPKNPGVEIIFGTLIGGTFVVKTYIADFLNAMIRSKSEQWTTLLSEKLSKFDFSFGMDNFVRQDHYTIKIWVKYSACEPWMGSLENTYALPEDGTDSALLAHTRKFGFPDELQFCKTSIGWFAARE